MIAVAVILTAVPLALLYAVIAVHNFLRRVLRVLNPAWLWFTGLPLDGHSRTNATWLRPSHGPRPVLHNSGHAVWWHHLPRLHRAGIRSGATGATAVTLYGLAVATVLTIAALCAVAAVLLAAGGWHAVYVVRNWRHERHYVRPLERTLADAIGAPPVSIEIERDGDEVKQVAIEWAPDTELGAVQKQAAVDAVTTRLALEAPDDCVETQGPQPVRGVHPVRAAAVTCRVGRRSPAPSCPPPRTSSSSASESAARSSRRSTARARTCASPAAPAAASRTWPRSCCCRR